MIKFLSSFFCFVKALGFSYFYVSALIHLLLLLVKELFKFLKSTYTIISGDIKDKNYFIKITVLIALANRFYGKYHISIVIAKLVY